MDHVSGGPDAPTTHLSYNKTWEPKGPQGKVLEIKIPLLWNVTTPMAFTAIESYWLESTSGNPKAG